MDKHLMRHDVVKAFYEPIKPVLFGILNVTLREQQFSLGSWVNKGMKKDHGGGYKRGPSKRLR